jgi:hypothetical protein
MKWSDLLCKGVKLLLACVGRVSGLYQTQDSPLLLCGIFSFQGGGFPLDAHFGPTIAAGERLH